MEYEKGKKYKIYSGGRFMSATYFDKHPTIKNSHLLFRDECNTRAETVDVSNIAPNLPNKGISIVGFESEDGSIDHIKVFHDDGYFYGKIFSKETTIQEIIDHTKENEDGLSRS